MTDDPEIIVSPLSGEFTSDGITVEVQIYRLATSEQWSLEVVDDDENSTVWDAVFETDQAAYDAFLEDVRTEGLAAIVTGDATTLH